MTLNDLMPMAYRPTAIRLRYTRATATDMMTILTTISTAWLGIHRWSEATWCTSGS